MRRQVTGLVGLATGVAIVLAVTVAAQTYLSMLGHGHSFFRILLWQLSSWMFWAAVSPLALRQGAELVRRDRRTWRDMLRVPALGAILLGAHAFIAAQFTTWLQPFVPVTTYEFTQAFVSQFPSRFGIDLLVYVLLLAGGGALSAYDRARRLELRESRLEAELWRAQLHALRLEIEPHFLFNTLNTIAALIRLKDNNRALEMLVGLSEFMRTNLDHPRDQLVPLSTEVDWVRRYVSLQQTRFGDRLEVSYDIDAGCSDVQVPTLMLQPLVENALRHGAARQARRCRVVIGANKEHGSLTLTVADDGAGVPADFDLDQASGTGLRNTASRLEHLYGRTATLDVRRAEPTGTIVQITLPITASAREVKATA